MDTEEIKVRPLGVIHTPYKEPEGMPIQGRFAKEIKGTITIFPEYVSALKDLDGFSHLILIYYFNRSRRAELSGRPYLEDEKHGIFAIRSPHRPNHLGISIVKLEGIKDNVLTFTEVDILDDTPLLDIKPYVAHFDARENIKSGWLDKHFAKGGIPRRTKLAK